MLIYGLNNKLKYIMDYILNHLHRWIKNCIYVHMPIAIYFKMQIYHKNNIGKWNIGYDKINKILPPIFKI